MYLFTSSLTSVSAPSTSEATAWILEIPNDDSTAEEMMMMMIVVANLMTLMDDGVDRGVE